MSNFVRLIRFIGSEDEGTYFADVGSNSYEVGTKVHGYISIDALKSKSDAKNVTISQLLAPTPTDSHPIYCVGLNFRNHVEEAGLTIPQAPAIWLKPAAVWANPEETVGFNKWCSENFPDYEGELVFITSKVAKDVSVADAGQYILGYTCGNDLTSRLHQDPKRSGGQYTYAKAFDRFAPIGPYLVPPSTFDVAKSSIQVRVNCEIRQNSPLDFVFTPEEILSHISQVPQFLPGQQ